MTTTEFWLLVALNWTLGAMLSAWVMLAVDATEPRRVELAICFLLGWVMLPLGLAAFGIGCVRRLAKAWRNA